MGNQSSELVLRNENIMTKIMVGLERETIEHLESERIEVDQPINQMGDTIGHYAAYRGQFQVLQYLVGRGDYFETPNYRGLSAIDVALPEVREWIYQHRKPRP